MSNPIVPFGKQFRAKYFTNMDDEVFPVNHGSYGLTPTPVLEKYLNLIVKNASYTDKFMKYGIKDSYVESLKAVGRVLNCDYHNLAFVDNATSGVNTILRSYPLKKVDKLVIQSTVYGACGNTVKFLHDRYGVEFIVVDLNYPITDEEILSKFERVFVEEKPKLCMFDTISSMPGVIFPYEKMTKLCKKYLVLSLIDGAHGIGCIPQDLGNLKPDFYVTNLHKWFYIPFGCAVLYIDPKHHNVVHTLPISHLYLEDHVKLSDGDQKNRLIDRFFLYGTKNFASIQVIPEAIKFRSEVCGGETKIYDYCHGLAKQVGELVSRKWGTSYLDQKGSTSISTMVTVEVPTQDYPEIVKNWSVIDHHVYNKMFDRKAYTPCIAHNGKLFARFSCQVYNELSDYDYASDVVLETLKEVASEQYKKHKL